MNIFFFKLKMSERKEVEEKETTVFKINGS